ncbi:hypothetical protein QZH41_016317, partial [Actinostola sp. cb2023]
MTTYRNLKLEHKETGKPPVFIGPLLMHQRKQRKNIKSYILSIGIPSKVCKEYLKDIFGEMRGSTFYRGIVDSTSEAVFYHKLSELKDIWGKREEPYVPKGKEPRIHDWFTKNKATDMKTSMIAPVRTDAGLGSPPMQYTTNDTEAGNFMAKHHLHFDKCNPHVFTSGPDRKPAKKRNACPHWK